MTYGHISSYSFTNNPCKQDSHLNQTLCLVHMGSGLEGFHCICIFDVWICLFLQQGSFIIETLFIATGRTHRSNQVSAPEYLFMISELAGEQRFASTVAKRLESLVRYIYIYTILFMLWNNCTESVSFYNKLILELTFVFSSYTVGNCHLYKHSLTNMKELIKLFTFNKVTIAYFMPNV